MKSTACDDLEGKRGRESFVDRARRVDEMTNATIEFVNAPDNALELDDLRFSAQRGRPFGSEDWLMIIAKRLGLESIMCAIVPLAANSDGSPPTVPLIV